MGSIEFRSGTRAKVSRQIHGCQDPSGFEVNVPNLGKLFARCVPLALGGLASCGSSVVLADFLRVS